MYMCVWWPNNKCTGLVIELSRFALHCVHEQDGKTLHTLILPVFTYLSKWVSANVMPGWVLPWDGLAISCRVSKYS